MSEIAGITYWGSFNQSGAGKPSAPRPRSTQPEWTFRTPCQMIAAATPGISTGTKKSARNNGLATRWVVFSRTAISNGSPIAMGNATSRKLPVTRSDLITSGSPTRRVQLPNPMKCTSPGRTRTRSVDEAPSEASIGPAKNNTKPMSQGERKSSPHMLSRRAHALRRMAVLAYSVWDPLALLVVDTLQRRLEFLGFDVDIQAGGGVGKAHV